MGRLATAWPSKLHYRYTAYDINNLCVLCICIGHNINMQVDRFTDQRRVHHCTSHETLTVCTQCTKETLALQGAMALASLRRQSTVQHRLKGTHIDKGINICAY